MFFKSRVKYDIDHKSLRALEDRRVQQSEHSGRLDLLSEVSVAGSAKPNDSMGDTPANANGGHAVVHKQSVVSDNASWEGKLTTAGSAWLEGEVSGEVEAGDTVYVARGAKVRANIQARRAIVGGDLEGQITCREQLVVECSGRLGGKVRAKTLVIEDGAVIHSEIQMLRDHGASGTAISEQQQGTAVVDGSDKQRLSAGNARESVATVERQRR